MSDTIEERNGELFVAMRDVLHDEPTEIVNLYPLGVHAYSLRHLVGRPVTFKDGVFRDEHGVMYPLRDGQNSKPTLTERTPVAEPKQRGRKLELKWIFGRWHKETKNGWRPA